MIGQPVAGFVQAHEFLEAMAGLSEQRDQELVHWVVKK
jgi:hypothetical protein